MKKLTKTSKIRNEAIKTYND